MIAMFQSFGLCSETYTGRETSMSNQSAMNDLASDSNDTSWTDALSAADRENCEPDEPEMLALLAQVVEGEIIPRLMLAHQNFVPASSKANPSPNLPEDEIEHFAKLTVSGEVDDLEDYIVGLTRKGVAEEAVYLELMAPAARKLGIYWEQDHFSFAEVTIGLGRLQTLLYRISSRHRGTYENQAPVAKGLFITPFGAQHSFGIRMVDDLFRRAGWKTICEPDISIIDLVSLVSTVSFDMVGLGLSVESQIDIAEEMIREVRAASRNRDVKIMLGGSLLSDRADIIERLGADFCALDAREAVTIARNVI
jgi:MerR family transcriptional regulator, light-induced transcriptional regulator